MKSMDALLIVSLILGAGLGGFFRFVFEYKFPPVGQQAFPVATLGVNIVGSFILGLVVSAPPLWHAAIGTGFCGALTTFSGVSLQLSRRLQARDIRQVVIYTLLLVTVCLASAWAGIQLGQSFG